MKIFQQIAGRADLDVILSYNHYTLQNNMLASQIEFLQSRGVGIMNAAPFSARLLTDAPLPVLAQGHAAGSRGVPPGGRALPRGGNRSGPIGIAILNCLPRNDNLHCWLRQSRSRRPLAAVDGQPLDEGLLAEVMKICSRFTTGSTSKADRKTTIPCPTGFPETSDATPGRRCSPAFLGSRARRIRLCMARDDGVAGDLSRPHAK